MWRYVSQMPRHLSDAHEWINEIPTVLTYYLANNTWEPIGSHVEIWLPNASSSLVTRMNLKSGPPTRREEEKEEEERFYWLS